MNLHSIFLNPLLKKKEALFMLFIKAYATSPTGGASGKTVKKPTTTGTTKTNMPSVKK